jgi:prepilin-type N-terminal cleavage/methylation domain-containing protein
MPENRKHREACVLIGRDLKIKVAMDIRLRNRYGFTLIELLVVIIILAVLIAIAVPTYLSQQKKAKEAKTQNALALAYRSARASLDTSGSYPAPVTLSNLIAADNPVLSVVAGASTLANTANPNVIVIGTNSTSTSLMLYSRSDSGNRYRLTASRTSAPAFANLGAPPTGYANAVLADSPLGFWRLADTNTTAAAAAGAVTGTYSGGYTQSIAGATTDGNNAASFGGSNGLVSFGNNFNFSGNSPYSLEAWIRPAGASPCCAYYNIFNKQSSLGGTDGEYAFFLANDGLIFYRGSDVTNNPQSNLQAASTITAGVWNYVVATYDGSTMRVYVNGVLRGSLADATASNTNTEPFRVAGGIFNSYFNGGIDEAAVYNKALTCGTTTVGQPCTSGNDIYDHYNAR